MTMENKTEITPKELERWWATLKIVYKERIASKATKTETHYPECSTWWNEQPLETKLAIYKHCHDDHGYYVEPWKEGKCFT